MGGSENKRLFLGPLKPFFLLYITVPIFSEHPYIFACSYRNPVASSLTTEPYTITLCKNEPATLDNKVTVNFNIPEGIDLKFGYIEIIAYSDPDDPYKRAIHLFIDGIGGPIGTERVGLHQYSGDTIEPGETVHRYYNLSRVKFGNAPEEDNGYFLIDFIPGSNETSPVKLTPGLHNATMCVSNEEKYCDFIVETRLTVYIRLNQQIPTAETGGGSVAGDSEIIPPMSEESFFLILYGILIPGLPAILGVTLLLISRRRIGRTGERIRDVNVMNYRVKKDDGPDYIGDLETDSPLFTHAELFDFDDFYNMENATKKICPQCGGENRADHKFCIFCGYKLL